MDVPVITVKDCGIWLDGNHCTADEFNAVIIARAMGHGFGGDDEAMLVARHSSGDTDVSQQLHDTASEAVDYLNERVPAGYYLEIDASMLVMRSMAEDYQVKVYPDGSVWLYTVDEVPVKYDTITACLAAVRDTSGVVMRLHLDQPHEFELELAGE